MPTGYKIRCWSRGLNLRSLNTRIIYHPISTKMADTGILPPLQYAWRNLSSPTRPGTQQLATHAIHFGPMPEAKNIGRDTVMVYLNLNKLEYSVIIKTWKQALQTLIDRLALSDVEVYRAALTDERLLLVFPDATGAMVVEKEFDHGIEVVPAGWTWSMNPIPRSMVQATGIPQLKLTRPLGRSFFHQVAIPRLLQLFAPKAETPPGSESSRLWGKITTVQPERCSGDSQVDSLVHKYMLYNMAKIALDRARSRCQREDREGRLGEVAKLNQDVDTVRKQLDEQRIEINQCIKIDRMSVKHLLRPVTPPSTTQNQQGPGEGCQSPFYEHRACCPPNWWPESSYWEGLPPGYPVPDSTQ